MKRCAIYHETKRENRLRLALGFGWVVLAFLVLANGCVESALAYSCPYDSAFMGTCNEDLERVLDCRKKNELNRDDCLIKHRGAELIECLDDARDAHLMCLEEEQDIE